MRWAGAGRRRGAGFGGGGRPGGAAPGARGGEVPPGPLPATSSGALDEAAVQEILDGLDRFRALVVGPGLGRATPTVAAVRRLVAEAPVPLVLDADGLNALDGDVELLARRPAAPVVTPHPREYARLAGEKVGDDRVAAARRLAERAGAVVVLKGSRTAVADPTRRAAVNPTRGPRPAPPRPGDAPSAAGAGPAPLRPPPLPAPPPRAAAHPPAAGPPR